MKRLLFCALGFAAGLTLSACSSPQTPPPQPVPGANQPFPHVGPVPKKSEPPKTLQEYAKLEQVLLGDTQNAHHTQDTLLTVNIPTPHEVGVLTTRPVTRSGDYLNIGDAPTRSGALRKLRPNQSKSSFTVANVQKPAALQRIRPPSLIDQQENQAPTSAMDETGAPQAAQQAIPARIPTPTQAPEALSTITPNTPPREALNLPAQNAKSHKPGSTSFAGLLLFPQDGTAVGPIARSHLRDVAQQFKEQKVAKIIVNGYSSKKLAHQTALDPSLVALRLSSDRAQAVRDILVKFGVPSNKIIFEGLGVKSSKTQEITPQQIAKNRRVEILFQY